MVRHWVRDRAVSEQSSHTITKEYMRVVSGLIQTEVLLVRHWVRDQAVSEQFILLLKNT